MKRVDAVADDYKSGCRRTYLMAQTTLATAATIFYDGEKVFSNDPTFVEQRRQSAATATGEAMALPLSVLSSSTASSMTAVATVTEATLEMVMACREEEEDKMVK